MKKEYYFYLLIIISIISIVLSFSTVFINKNMEKYPLFSRAADDCISAMVFFENLKENSNCVYALDEQKTLVTCEDAGNKGEYELYPGEYKKWVFTNNGEKEEYIFYFQSESCEKR